MNSAERLLAIYDQLAQQQHEVGMQALWARIFELNPDSPDVQDHVATCLMAMRSEIQLTRSLLSEHDVPATLQGPGLDRLYEVAAPAYLNNNWHGLRGNVLPPENRVSLAWASWALREEEQGDVPAEDRQDLVREIAALEASLGELSMSPYMRGFIKRQIETIRLALRLYGIQGTAPLQDALRRVVGDFKVEDAKVRAEHSTAGPETQTLWARTTSVIEKAAKLADQGAKLKKGAEDLGTLAGAAQEQIGSIFSAVKPLLLSFTTGAGGGP